MDDEPGLLIWEGRALALEDTPDLGGGSGMTPTCRFNDAYESEYLAATEVGHDVP
jgi:hypothetical protein